MGKTSGEYVADLLSKSRALDKIRRTKDIPYGKANELRKQEHEIHQKYTFAKNLLKAKREREREK